jgi:hypothetical protein
LVLKADPTKRGRFNACEKFVLVMCESAKVTSTNGQIQFLPNGRRKETDEVKTEAGTIFEGKLEMTDEEWEEVGRQVKLLFPPILTTYNGEALPERIPTKVFKAKLPTEVANERGVLHQRNVQPKFVFTSRSPGRPRPSTNAEFNWCFVFH